MSTIQRLGGGVRAAVLGGLLAGAVASPAYATLTITDGTFGGGSQGQVLFNRDVPAMTIFGDLNSGPTDAIRFTSATDVLVPEASGQARER